MTTILTPRQVAKRYGVTTETLRRWVAKDQIPAFRLPSGQIRFRLEDLDAHDGITETGAA